MFREVMGSLWWQERRLGLAFGPEGPEGPEGPFQRLPKTTKALPRIAGPGGPKGPFQTPREPGEGLSRVSFLEGGFWGAG